MSRYKDIDVEDIKDNPSKYLGIEDVDGKIICGYHNDFITLWNEDSHRYMEMFSVRVSDPDYKPEVKPETRDDIIKHLDGIIKLLKQA